MAQKELLEEGASSAFSDAEEGVIDGDLRAVSVTFRVVQRRHAGGAEIREYVGVVWLPVAVVAFADDGGRDRVKRAM